MAANRSPLLLLFQKASHSILLLRWSHPSTWDTKVAQVDTVVSLSDSLGTHVTFSILLPDSIALDPSAKVVTSSLDTQAAHVHTAVPLSDSFCTLVTLSALFPDSTTFDSYVKVVTSSLSAERAHVDTAVPCKDCRVQACFMYAS